jgi:hypothetical protein
VALALCFQLDQVLEHRRVAQPESAAFTRPRPQVRALPCLALDLKSRFSPGSRHSRGAGQGTNRDFQFPPVDFGCRSSSLRFVDLGEMLTATVLFKPSLSSPCSTLNGLVGFPRAAISPGVAT